MKILFNDICQNSTLASEMKSGALSECYKFDYNEHVFTVDFPLPVYIDCVGIGYTDAAYFNIAFDGFGGFIFDGAQAVTPDNLYTRRIDGGGAYDSDYRYLFGGENGLRHDGFSQIVYFRENGLYKLDRPAVTRRFTVETDASYIGRLAAGRAVTLGTALAKEPSFNNSEKTRRTLSGQAIAGVGGYNYRAVSLDTRYKIGEAEMAEIKAAYNGQTGPGLPFFLLFEEEARRLPFIRLYAADKKNAEFSFQSGVHNRFLFSRKFDFEECF